MPPPTAAAFLETAAKSRLLDPGRLAGAAAGRDAAAVADSLVEAGALTRFQADKLLHGYWQGLVVGPYRVLSPLGRGGVGIVYLARDGRPGAATPLVALKVLPPRKARNEPRTLARFRREMAIGPALPNHPALTRTTDAGEVSGVHFLAMEYVPGPTVRQAIAAGGPMPVGAACRAFADAAGGLAAAHAAGFVHRDFKPANLIVTPLGRGKVLDFGFALRVGEPTPADPTVIGGRGYTLGTMDYIAPEQAADAARVGPPADVYAFGCGLYFALAGCPPFPGGGTQEKIRWHRTATPPPIVQINPAVPPELDRLVHECMAKDPTARPTAASLAKELAAWADPIRVPASDEGTDEGELLRTAERGWQAALTDETSEPAGSDEPILGPAESARVRLPVAVRAIVALALLAAAAFFAIGFAAGLAAGGR